MEQIIETLFHSLNIDYFSALLLFFQQNNEILINALLLVSVLALFYVLNIDESKITYLKAKNKLRKKQKSALAKTTIKSVLIVDDDPTTIELIALILSKNGVKYQKAYNAKDALAAISYLWGHHEFDLIITDINMPDMDGIELGRTLHDHYPILMISGQNIDDKTNQILDNSDAFIDKKLTRDFLLEYTKKAINNWNSHKNFTA